MAVTATGPRWRRSSIARPFRLPEGPTGPGIDLQGPCADAFAARPGVRERNRRDDVHPGNRPGRPARQAARAWLSKRVGTTSKEMLAVLARAWPDHRQRLRVGAARGRHCGDRALSRHARSASRPRHPPPRSRCPPPRARRPALKRRPAGRPRMRPHRRPPSLPLPRLAASVADPLNPLFLPPTEVTAPTGLYTADGEPDQAEQAPAESAAKRPRRRRGRSSGRRDTDVPVDTAGAGRRADVPIETGRAGRGVDRTRRRTHGSLRRGGR